MRGWSFLPAVRNHSLPRLTDQGLQKIYDLARHYGVSTDAVMTLWQALLNSKGSMAQFDHRELGGAGQWMPGGMTMVGDMFNHGLKAKVDGLCSELSQILAMQPFVPFPAGFRSQSQRQGGGQQEGGPDVLESVRRLQAGLQSFLSMRRIEARRKNASAFRLRFSQSLASLRQRLSQAMDRSTIQRLGKTTNPLARSERLTISMSRCGNTFAIACANCGP